MIVLKKLKKLCRLFPHGGYPLNLKIICIKNLVKVETRYLASIIPGIYNRIRKKNTVELLRASKEFILLHDLSLL